MLGSPSDISVARQRISQIFRETNLWAPPFRGDPYPTNNNKYDNTMEESALEILNWLKTFPSLATEKFGHPVLEGRLFGDADGCYPLTFFAWSNQNNGSLDTVYDLYPEALTKPQLRRSGLLDLQCDWMFATEDTLMWLLQQSRVLEESIPYRLILYSPRLYQKTTIQALIRKTPALHEERSSNQLANLLLARGYGPNVLSLVATLRNRCCCGPLALNTNGIAWELDTRRATTIAHMLPSLDSIRLERLQWTCNGWKTVLAALSSECPNLRSLHLQVDTSWLLQHPAAVDSLELLLGCNAAFIGSLSLKLIGEPGPRDPEKNVRLMKSLLRGLESNPTSTMVLEVFDVSFMDIETTALAKLEGQVGSLCLHHVQILPVETKVPSKAQTLWNAVALLHAQNIERHLPVRGTDGLVHASSLYIDNGHWRRRGVGQIIITDILVSILEAQPLQELRINLPRHAFDAEQVCEVLRDNTSLETLSLVGMDFLGDEESHGAPAQFCRILEEKNTTLRNLTIYNRQQSLTVSERPRPLPMDTPSAEHIEHLLLLNQYGRSQMRQECTTKQQIMTLLWQVQEVEGSSAAMESSTAMSESLILEDWIRTKELGHQDAEPLVQSTYLYELLRKTVDCWCESRKQGAREQSILYGLLREYPDLWCLGD